VLARHPFPLQSVERLFHEVSQRDVPFVRQLLKAVDGVESIDSPFQQFAKRYALVVGNFVESPDRFRCRLGVELLIAASPVDARLGAVDLRGFGRLPTWKVVLRGDALNGFQLNGLFAFGFVVKAGGRSFNVANGLTRVLKTERRRRAWIATNMAFDSVPRPRKCGRPTSRRDCRPPVAAPNGLVGEASPSTNKRRMCYDSPPWGFERALSVSRASRESATA
jgi:hypothetical protein